MKRSTEARLEHLALLAEGAAADALNARAQAENALDNARIAPTLASVGTHTRTAFRYSYEALGARDLAIRAAAEAKAHAGIGPTCGNSNGLPLITDENRGAIALAQKAVTYRDQTFRDSHLAEDAARDSGLLFESRLKMEIPE